MNYKCFINWNNKINIPTNNYRFPKTFYYWIKKITLKGEEIKKESDGVKETVNCFGAFYDDKRIKKYIIQWALKNIKSYNYGNRFLHKK